MDRLKPLFSNLLFHHPRCLTQRNKRFKIVYHCFSDTEMDTQMGLLTTSQYLIIYGSVVLGIIIFAQVRILTFVAMAMRASANLHDVIYRKLIVAVMRFFDTNPSGE